MHPGTREVGHHGAKPFTVIALAVAGTSVPAPLVGSLALELRREIGLSAAELGWAIAGFFAAAAITAVPFGSLADRLGSVRSLRLTAVVNVASLWYIALGVRNEWQLIAAVTIAGSAIGLARPAANRAVLLLSSTRRLALTFGLQQAAIPVAMAFAGASLTMVSVTGWRWSFLVASSFCVASLVLGRELTEPAGSMRSDTTHGRVAALPLRGLAPLSVAAALGTLTFGALSGFYVTGAVANGLGTRTAGVLVVIGSAAGFCVRILAGWVADRRGGAAFELISLMLGTGAAGLLLLAVPNDTTIVLGTLLTFTGGWGWIGLMHYSVVRSFPSAPARATGIVQIGLASGTALGPVAFAFLLRSSGAGAAWSMLGLAALLAAVVMRLTGPVVTGEPADAEPAPRTRTGLGGRAT